MAKRASIDLQEVEARPRRRSVEEEADVELPSYFASGNEKEGVEFTSTGCALYDEALGGGPCMGRVLNIVGDKSTGKTLNAMEIAAQTLRIYPDAWVRYGEAEAAWDADYQAELGIPISKMILNEKNERLETVEQWYDDLVACLDKFPDRPGVYILDSLDALSDDAEMEADFNKASFGGMKPKAIGQLFRRLVGRLERQRVLLIIVSQLRDKIGVTFGETKTRSGGKALDFYASQIVWLRETGKLKRTISGEERVYGIEVRAQVKKNKVGIAFREAQYPVLFGYGIDDLMASAEWIAGVAPKRLVELGMKKEAGRARTKAEVKAKASAPPDKHAALPNYADEISRIRRTGGAEAQAMREKLTKIVREEWARIETEFLPPVRKYE